MQAHVLTAPASTCLLVGAFNPLTVKVIIDMYDPTTIFLIALDLFCVDLFLLLSFLPREFHLYLL